MKRWTRRSALALLLAASVTGSLAIAPVAANAASDFDSFLNVTPNLYVYTDGSTKTQTLDISTTWWGDYQEAYALRVAQNIGFPTNFVTEFEDIKESGGSWGVFTQEDGTGIRITIVGTHDPDAYCGFEGDAIDGIYRCITHAGYGYVKSEYFTHSSYGSNGCMGSGGYRCSTNEMGIYQAPVVVPDGGSNAYYALVVQHAEFSFTDFFFMNFDLVYPSGYEGLAIPTEYVAPDPLEYVALGDSYSAGVGSFNTDISSDGCYQSTSSYPYYVLNNVPLDTLVFTACNGATTSDLFNGPPLSEFTNGQSTVLSGDTRVVTLTIGGNDLGFADILKRCVNHMANNGFGCSSNEDVQDRVALGLTGLSGTSSSSVVLPTGQTVYSFAATLSLIMAEAPAAKVYIAGYPHIFGDNPTYYSANSVAPGGYECIVKSVGGVSVVGVSITDAEWMNDQVDAINTLIEDAVEAVNNPLLPRVFYVPPTTFDTHALCDSGVSYLNPLYVDVVMDGFDVQSVSIDPEIESFHPTVTGMQSGYGVAFKDAMYIGY